MEITEGDMMIEDNLNLIRKIAWGYVKGNPGLEFDDIFQGACLAYLEVQSRYDPHRGKESTFIWHVVNNYLRTLLGRENKRYTTEINGLEDSAFPNGKCPSTEQEVLMIEEQEQWDEIMLGLSPEAQFIRELVLQEESTLPIHNPKRCKRQIADTLIEQGWGWQRIWSSFREIKTALV